MNDPTDQDLWGGYLNSNFSNQDTVVKAISNTAQDAQDEITDFITSIAPILTASIRGLNTSRPSNTTISVTSGAVFSDDGAMPLSLNTTFTKSISSTWVSGSGNGGLDTGSVANNTFYYMFMIGDPTNSLTDVLISTSRNSPTLPTNYIKKRYIGAFRTNASSQILNWHQVGQRFTLDTPIPMGNQLVGATPVDFTSIVPPGLTGIFSGRVGVSTPDEAAYFNVQRKGATGTSETDLSTAIMYARRTASFAIDSAHYFECDVDNSSLVTVYRVTSTANISGNVFIATRGWIDPRNV